MTDIRRFTDRVGLMTSTDLDAFLREHRALVVTVFQSHGGHVVKEIGDAYLATFESSTTALLACIDLQRQLAVAGADRPLEERAEIRIAVSAGDVLVQEGDVFGTPVNTAARVETVTPPGDIYFTEAVYQNVNRNEVASELVGEYSLKGLTEPVRVHRTTFRHQTRTIRDTTVLLTDIAHFAEFAKSGSLGSVEALLEWWERAHREVAKGHGGVVRAVSGDAFVMTFDVATQALEAWLDLHVSAQVFNADPDRPLVLEFMAGIDRGDIRLFRSALYGRPLDGADFCCRQSPVNALGVPSEVMPQFGSELLTRVAMESGTFQTESAVSRARRAGVESFMILKPR